MRRLSEAARERWLFLPIIAVMFIRAYGLYGQPFELSRGTTVPVALWGLFVVGGFALLSLWLHPLPWNGKRTEAAAMAVAAPYVIYAGWVLTHFGFVFTLADLVLIPWIVGTTWGRVQPTERARGYA